MHVKLTIHLPNGKQLTKIIEAAKMSEFIVLTFENFRNIHFTVEPCN